MPALRILHVTPYFEAAWAYGGIPRLVAALAHAQVRAGHRVTVATTDVRDATSRLESTDRGHHARLAARVERTEDGIDVAVFPNVSNALAYRWQFYQPVGLASYVRSNAGRFDVAHLHACHNLPTALAARHLRRAGVPYVVQPNGTALRIERRRAAKAVFDFLLARDLLPGAAFVVAVTEWERRQLQDAGIAASRLKVVPNPVAPVSSDALPGRGAFRRLQGLGDGPLVVFLGVLSPRKQPAVLARAVSQLPRKDVQLVFAGNDMGAGRATRHLVRRLGLEARTRFTGLISGGARFAALADADVVVYPSRDEAFGLVPIESLQAGTPVIVCDDAGCGEVISAVGGGWLVPPGDAGAVATALQAMLEDADRWREAAVRAGATVRQRFHPDVVAAQLDNVYREAIVSSKVL